MKNWNEDCERSMYEHESIMRNEKCPKCGQPLITNDAGQVWCSAETGCDYSEK